MKPHMLILAATLTGWAPGGQALGADPVPEAVGARDDFQRRAEQELGKLEQKLDALERKLGAARGEARKRLQRSLEELRKQEGIARRRLEQLRSSGQATWKDLRERVERALEEFRKRLERTEEDNEPVWT
jgi:hypothetical protein